MGGRVAFSLTILFAVKLFSYNFVAPCLSDVMSLYVYVRFLLTVRFCPDPSY